MSLIFTACSKLCNGSVLVLSVTFLFVCLCVCLFVNQISLEPLNRFVQNSHGRHVWSLARMSLNVKVKGQGHQGQNALCTSITPCQ